MSTTAETNGLWAPGTEVTIRGVVHNRVWIAHAMTVVEDSSTALITYLTPRAPCKIPKGLLDRKWGGGSNGGSRWDEQDGRQWELVDWRWKHRHSLTFLPVDKFYGIFWFWLEKTGEFECWYVNFQLPFQKSGQCVNTLDLELDLIVRPDGSWYWKDETEYLEGIRRGSIPAEVAGQVEIAREEVISSLPTLFDPKWLDWRPAAHWEVPQLSPDWNVVH
jgi:protein associated with RNAse G/E